MIRCHKPFFSSAGFAFNCGKCAACLSRRRRTWAARLILEAAEHPGRSVFATLTYARDVPSLNIRDMQLFLKKLRKKQKLRVFYCGEYGDTTQRPHYHAVLYGLASCLGGPLRRVGNGHVCICETCSLIRDTWGHGHVTVGSLTPARAMYIAGYVVKKMTHRKDPRLYGRDPEFARMSLRPGIGASAVSRLSAAVAARGELVPAGLFFGDRRLPIGRYLRRLIAAGLTDGTKQAVQAICGVPDTVSKNKEAVSLLRAYAAAVDKPVEKVWSEVLGVSAETLVIPAIPTLHRPISEEVRNV